MEIVVQKYGGTSVGDIDRIKSIPQNVLRELNKNNKVIVVVSAMAGVTNMLLSSCREISCISQLNATDTEGISQYLQELDSIISTGEIVSSGLVAIALQKSGIKAVSLQGWQLPIITDKQHSKALIKSIDASLILYYLRQGIVPVICGFQGINSDNKITTLGKNGSDITAAAVAAKVKAARCDIFKDVEGVFTADPRIVHDAKKIPFIDYESMLEFSHCGAFVLHPRCIYIANKFSIPLRVIPYFIHQQKQTTELKEIRTTETEMIGADIIGTKIGYKKQSKKNTIKNMETSSTTGITYNKNIIFTKIEIQNNSSKIIAANNRSNNILHKIISQQIPLLHYFDETHYEENKSFCSIILPLNEMHKIKQSLEILKTQNEIIDFQILSDIAFINIVGYNLLNDYQQLSKINDTLLLFECKMMQFQHNKISILLDENLVDKILKELHQKLIGTSL